MVFLEKSKSFMHAEQRTSNIARQVTEIFETKKLYTQPQLTLNDLSQETQFSVNLLSAYFHQVLGTGYNDFVNRLRVQYFKEILKNRDFIHYTLAALAKQCGFHNRNTFSAAFKKLEGITPSRYVRLYQESLYMEEAI
jgi:AraC-like DNA-binding protein